MTQIGIVFATPGGNNPFSVSATIDGVSVHTNTFSDQISFTAIQPATQETFTPAQFSATPAKQVTVTSGGFFTEVQGTGTIAFPVGTETGTLLGVSGGNTDATQVTTASVTFQITYTYTAAVSGDPQIVGFQGQRYQIHGIPDEHFALISTPTYFMNSRFTYISTGSCTYNDTECFSHAGTYISELGVVTGSNQLKLVAGSHEHGLQVYLNNELVSVGISTRLSMDSMVRVISKSRAKIVFPDVTITVANSDHFFNLGADFTDAKFFEAGRKQLVIASTDAKQAAIQIAHTYPEYNMHGLLGQTWRNIVWPHQRLYEGEPTDYQTNDIFSSEFLYSQFVASNSQ